LGQPIEKMGDAQWIGHILKRLHLVDDTRRKRGMDGMTYAIQPSEVKDIMRRYEVTTLSQGMNTFSAFSKLRLTGNVKPL
jgi:hypothetical protein